MPLQKVVAIQDGDCHWYVILSHLRESFRTIEEDCAKIDDYDEFEHAFAQYRTGGDLNNTQLYADI